MKGKFDSLLYSVVGVVAVLIIIVAINLLGGLFKFRSDLTENKLYTLSDGTKKILNKLDTDVVVRFYFSKDNASVPVPLRTYAQEVQDLLDEYQQYSHGKVKVIKLDPKPDSDAEDSANLDGIEGQAVDLTDKVYLGHSRQLSGRQDDHSLSQSGPRESAGIRFVPCDFERRKPEESGDRRDERAACHRSRGEPDDDAAASTTEPALDLPE